MRTAHVLNSLAIALALVLAVPSQAADVPAEADAVRANVGWGPGPRAAQALMLTVRAKALIDGRLAPSAEDVADMAAPVLTHRMALTFAARARGATLSSVIDEVTNRITRWRNAISGACR